MKLRLTAAMAMSFANRFAAVPLAGKALTSDPLISNSPLSTTATAHNGPQVSIAQYRKQRHSHDRRRSILWHELRLSGARSRSGLVTTKTTRRAVFSIPLARPLAPFGQAVNGVGLDETRSFAPTMLGLVQGRLAALQGAKARGVEAAPSATALLGLFTPLCSSAAPTLVLAALHWTAAHA
jgi:hypothetical protein